MKIRCAIAQLAVCTKHKEAQRSKALNRQFFLLPMSSQSKHFLLTLIIFVLYAGKKTASKQMQKLNTKLLSFVRVRARTHTKTDALAVLNRKLHFNLAFPRCDADSACLHFPPPPSSAHQGGSCQPGRETTGVETQPRRGCRRVIA